MNYNEICGFILIIKQYRDFIKIMIKDYHFNIENCKIENFLDIVKTRL